MYLGKPLANNNSYVPLKWLTKNNAIAGVIKLIAVPEITWSAFKLILIYAWINDIKPPASVATTKQITNWNNVGDPSNTDNANSDAMNDPKITKPSRAMLTTPLFSE